MNISIGRWVGIGGLALAMMTGCAKTGSVHEKVPLTADIASFKSAAIEVDMPASVKNADTQKSAFASTIGDKLKEKNIFGEILPGSADLTLKVHVTSVDEGSKLAQAMGPGAGGDAEVAVSVELFDTKENRSIAAFDVTGNSKKDAQVKVGGVNTAAMEDTTNRALGAAADEIVGYLEKHRRATK